MTRPRMLHEKLTHSVIGRFFEVYNTLGYGLLEPVYMNALELELLWAGHRVAREVWVTVMHKGFKVGKHRLDMVVDDVLVIEGKSTYKLPERATRQLYNYVRVLNVDVALLLHFGPEPQFFRVMPLSSPNIQASRTKEETDERDEGMRDIILSEGKLLPPENE